MMTPHANSNQDRPDIRTSRFWSDAHLVAWLILLAVIPYANTLLNGFVYDDHTQVTNNPYLHSFRHLKDIFTTTVWSYVGAQGLTNYYRPLMTFGYLLCYQIFGPLAYGFHLANVVLHAAVVCVLFGLTKRLFVSSGVAFAAAALFALHPIHTESVAWIAAVTDLQLTLFVLLTFWCFLAVARPGGHRSVVAEIGMVGSFVLALLAKEQALMLPFLATSYEHIAREDRRETNWTQKLARYGLLWLLALAYVLFRVRFFGSFAPVVQLSSLTWYEAVLSGLALLGQYLGKMLWPVELSAFYVFRASSTVLDPRVLAGLAALILVGVCLAFLWNRSRAAAFGLLWFLVTIAPVLNARWMAANVFAERYLYLPSVGFTWAVAWGIHRLWQRATRHGSGWRRALTMVLVTVGILAGTRIFLRNRDWRDDVRLYTRTLAVAPNAYHIRNNLGAVYWDRGDTAVAEREWKEALRHKPDNVIVLNNLGLVARKEKRYQEAISYFQRALRRKPNYTDPHLNLGVTYVEMGERLAAEEQLRVAVALSPLNYQARNHLGRLCLESGRLEEAAEQFRLSFASQPNFSAFEGLGEVHLRWNQPDLAEHAFRRALELNPYDSSSHFKLAELCAARGRTEEAVRAYEAGLATDPNNVAARRALQDLTTKK